MQRVTYNVPNRQAAKIAAYQPGSAVALYVTSDGGASLQDVDDMVRKTQGAYGRGG